MTAIAVMTTESRPEPDRVLVVLTEVERQLAAITTVDEAKAIRDEAEMFRVYAKRAQKGLAAQNRCALIKILAECKAGEFLAKIERADISKNASKTKVHAGPSFSATIKTAGIALTTAGRWQVMANVPEVVVRQLFDEAMDSGHELTSVAVFRVGATRRVSKVTRRVRDGADRRFDDAVFAKRPIADQWGEEWEHMQELCRATAQYFNEIDGADRRVIASHAQRIENFAAHVGTKLDLARKLERQNPPVTENLRRKSLVESEEMSLLSDEQIERRGKCTIIHDILPADAPPWLRVVEVRDRRAGTLKVLFDLRKKMPHVPPIRGERQLSLRHDDVVADLGAFVGTFATRCAAFPVREVRAYEPAPFAAAVCRANGVPTIEAAVVGDGSRRFVDFEISTYGLGCTSRLQDATAHAAKSRRRRSPSRIIKVPAISYAEAVKDATVVKIDVEDAEYDYPLVQPSMRALLLDFHPWPPATWRHRADEICDDLRDHGFEAVVSPRLEDGKTLLMGSLWVRSESSGPNPIPASG